MLIQPDDIIRRIGLIHDNRAVSHFKVGLFGNIGERNSPQISEGGLVVNHEELLVAHPLENDEGRAGKILFEAFAESELEQFQL